MSDSQIIGMEPLIADLYRLQLMANSSANVFAKMVLDAWIYQIFVTHSIDTGAFLHSVDYRLSGNLDGGDPAELQQYVVDTSKDVDVNYSSLLERGTTNIEGSVKMAARWPAKKAIESLNFVGTIDRMVGQSFQRGI